MFGAVAVSGWDASIPFVFFMITLCPLKRLFYVNSIRRKLSRRNFSPPEKDLAHPEAAVGRGVYIGSYCVFGRARIGDRTQIASGVQILSGRRQHARTAEGAITGAEQGVFETVTVGADCWLGAAAIVMADVGEGTTIGAGSVVTRPVPARSVAVGSPARVLESPGGPEPA